MAREVETTTDFVTKSDGIEARITMPAETYRSLVSFLEAARVVMEGTDNDMPEDVSNQTDLLRTGLDLDLDPR